MDNKPVRNPDALRNLNIAIAYLSLAAVQFGTKDQTEQEAAADAVLVAACTLQKQVTK